MTNNAVTETETKAILPSPVEFITGEQASELVLQVQPTGAQVKKSWLNISASYFSRASTLTTNADGSWRMAVLTESPRFGGVIGALLAQKFSITKKRGFIFTGKPNAAHTVAADSHHLHQYTVINGIPLLMEIEMEKMLPFADKKLNDWYLNPIFATENFEDAMKVIRSEIVGGEAFPR